MKTVPLLTRHRRLHVLIAAALLLLSAFLFVRYAANPVRGGDKTVLVEIPKGARFVETVDVIDKAGLITNKPFFYILAVTKGAARHIRAGEYEFASAMSPAEIIDKLVKGEIKEYRVLLREDITARDIADRLVADKLINERIFMDLVTDRAFLSSLGILSGTAEGYLYPSTYMLNRSMTEKQIIKMMVNQFWKVVTPTMQRRASDLGLTTTEFVTLASMIGKETGNKEEKPLVSAVFHNRLKKGIKLQSDPTAVYHLEYSAGAVTKRQLKNNTPHNTYQIEGLPPGPIANPGIDSLRAALYPAPVKYLYFVAKNDGTHCFTTNLADHNDAVLKYQIERQKD